MRKLILEFVPNEIIRKVQKPLFENLESYELIEMLRKDYEEGVKIGLMIFNTKGDIPIQEVKFPENIEILLKILKLPENIVFFFFLFF